MNPTTDGKNIDIKPFIFTFIMAFFIAISLCVFLFLNSINNTALANSNGDENKNEPSMQAGNEMVPSQLQEDVVTIQDGNIDKVLVEPFNTDDMTESDLFKLKTDINMQYENHIKHINILTVIELNRLVDMCDTVLVNGESYHFRKVKMNVIFEAGRLTNDKLIKKRYYEQAKEEAYAIMQLYSEDYYSRIIQYSFAQLSYELASIEVSTEDLYMTKELFNSLKEYQPYWSRHYIISINRQLYNISNDLGFLYETEDIIKNEMLFDSNIEMQTYQILSLYVNLIDIEYLSAEAWLYKDCTKVKQHYDAAMVLVEESKEFGDSPYLEQLVKKMEDYLHENEP